MTRFFWALCGIATLLAPATASAVVPNPLFGPYLFLGGGGGFRVDDPTAAAPEPEFRWGPTVELGGDLAFFTLAAATDLRISGRTMAGGATPLDIDLLGALGLVTPTPLVRLFVRLRGGIGWALVPGVKAPADPSVVVFAPEIGLRFRIPNAPAAFQIAIGSGTRVPIHAPESAAVEVELRLGLKFP